MSGTTNPGERRCSSAPRRAATIFRLLDGECREVLSRERGIAAALARWRDDFLAGGEAAPRS